MPSLDALTWNQLVEELRHLAAHKPSADDEEKDDPRAALHDLFVHQVELEMQNRELRDAQQQLEASRARYADLYDFAPVGCLTLDRDERIQEINLSGAALLERDRAEIVGKPFLAVARLGDETLPFHDHVRRCMDQRCKVDDELEFFPHGRLARLLHISSAPMLDADGKVVGCRTALTDVTQRRRAERAEADAQLKEQFLAIVSHELRTPLSAIVGWGGVLQQRDRLEGEIDRGVLRQGLEVIMRNAAMQNRLIEDLLDVSRILAGKFSVDLKPTDLEPIVRAAVDSQRTSAEAKGIALSATVSPGAFVLGDDERLMQVMTNLMNNALKFTPAGGKIEVEVAVEKQSVRLVVRDTGRGIAKQDLSRIFERFKQVDGSTIRTAGGLGLGLAIVEAIVLAHEGNVSAFSPGLGLGATFKVQLPRADRAEERTRAVAPGIYRARALDGYRILYVDDDDDALEVLALILRERGAEVRTARSAAEAMTALIESTPDVVVSDIGMPVEDGFALMHRIRTLPGDVAHVPAIALTAFAGAACERSAVEAGFQRFLSKPVRTDDLVHAIATVIGQ